MSVEIVDVPDGVSFRNFFAAGESAEVSELTDADKSVGKRFKFELLPQLTGWLSIGLLPLLIPDESEGA
ncbi:unnamed protein product [Schistosoma margrebowiei]|uniref:Uncharacterized protein n=1 Tax=Schistosoma margrebowiei TaxID=48269 RepID=A0A3P8HK30_9TREM|nr:unnamed protein product [Schistosoma margrebowiei]